jgi:BirA family biotin operon repressor/biotin-[acetyl-CoA-carboxylase] ligase
MGFALGPIAEQAGYRLAAYDTIGSTSTEALARARLGDPGRLWVVARVQTAGHGRRGRAWSTPAGNLAASLLLNLPSSHGGSAATLGFVAGLALADAIGRTTVSGGLQLKWPNDILLNGDKVAGILLQAVSAARGAANVVIGIGVNVAHAPAGLPYPATSLAACGTGVTAEQLFSALSDSWVERQQIWDGGHGFAMIREDWLNQAAGLGGPLAVIVGGETLRGVFETIGEDGRLILRTADGRARHVTAGEVHFGEAATAVA